MKCPSCSIDSILLAEKVSEIVQERDEVRSRVAELEAAARAVIFSPHGGKQTVPVRADLLRQLDELLTNERKETKT